MLAICTLSSLDSDSTFSLKVGSQVMMPCSTITNRKALSTKKDHQRQRNQPQHADEVFLQAGFFVHGHLHAHPGKEQQQKGQSHQCGQQQIDAQPGIRIVAWKKAGNRK